ncbi:MAG: substrate-binding domain-containing protein [Bryobacterales bacterium]|nr:substrate-binding domain-containing protein [Bryobacterales bacterium]
MVRRSFLLLALVGLTLFAASCNRSTKKRIGVVPKAVAHIFWQSVHAGAVAAGREADVEIEWKGPPTETDFSRQIEIVDSMINAHLDGIVLAPTEATSLVSVVERASREGIPLAIFDSGINTDQYVSYVSTNNYDAGVLAAKALGELTGGQGKIAMVKMVPGSSSTMEREKGFEDTIAKEFPGIQKVAEQYCMSDRAKALAVTENMLTANPDLTAVFASAEPATVGAAQAFKARDMAGKIKLVGFDSSESIEKDLRDGVIDALVVQDPFNIGYQAVKAVIAAMNGETPAKRVDSPATVVTRDNVDSPEIDKLLHPDLSKYLE